MKKSFYQYFLIPVAIFCLSSCVQQKQIAYFQKVEGQSDTLAVAQTYTPKIQPGDILDIKVGSLNPLASSFFNPFSTMSVNPDLNETNAQAANGIAPTPSLSQSAAPGFLIDSDGTIDYPLIGNVKLGGLTTAAARDTIKNKLKRYLKEPTVTVRVLNYKISVMGEVVRPSVYVIPNERITLPEAISLAGDLTIYARRDNIMVIRDVDGKKEFGKVNLNSREVYNSPYYYLHNNDVVYVEPGKGKAAQSDRIYQILPIILSALSFITIIVTYTHR